ncbi:MAG TPA: aminotransferase class III-fold pyridoxal phosphate-dependent enzyme [Planctomycetota bacterium]|jgi:glutamate-1-semialdehyde 2,1-aminomutase|nr:aminotransferase class III-fold pyridoxal phosphate-dependent enzyme [Planctomycetota bacterium]
MSPDAIAPPRARYARSRDFHDRASRVLAGGVSSEFRKAGAPHPLCYVRASGARIHDLDGNEYLDFSLSQGPMILGHSRPEVLEAVARAMSEGQAFAGQHELEVELAERIQRLVPCAELLRFGLSGSEADHAALRVARAATGRPTFLRFQGHYHGWLDNAVPGLLPALAPAWTQGLPPGAARESITVPWNDAEAVARAFAERGGEIAAVICEPVMCNTGCIPPEPGFLATLRELCDAHGAVLIFDEVITGFRLGLAGAQGHYGVVPDLAVFGKAMASGWPVSVLAGKRRFMNLVAEGRVIHAGTLNAWNAGIAAADATIEILEREGVHERLFALGRRLMDGLRAAARDAGRPLLVQGPGPMFHTGFTTLPRLRDAGDAAACDRALYGAFASALQDRGIRVIGRGLWYVSAAHTEEDIDVALAAARDALESLP